MITLVLAKGESLSPDGLIIAIESAKIRQVADARPHVLRYAKQSKGAVQEAAIMAMAKLGTIDDLPWLIETTGLEKPVGETAYAALVGFGAIDTNAALIKHLDTQQGGQLISVIKALGDRGANDATAKLLFLARDQDDKVRRAAFTALGQVINTSQVDDLIDLLVSPASPGDVGAIGAAVEAASSRMRDKSACTNAVLKRIDNATSASVVAMLRVLPTLGDKAALPAIRARVSAKDEQVRDAAVRALIAWRNGDAAKDLLQVVKSSDSKAHRVLSLRRYIEVTNGGKQLAEAMQLTERPDEKRMVLGKLPNEAVSVTVVAGVLEDKSIQREAIDALIRVAEKLKKGASPDIEPTLRKAAPLIKDDKTRARFMKVVKRHGVELAASEPQPLPAPE